MITWGLSFGSHDAALAVFDQNAASPLVFASHSERFSKKKDDPELCQALIDHAVSSYGRPQRIYYYETPWKKKLRYIRSGQFRHLLDPSPSSVLRKLGITSEVVNTDHHHSHAAAGYYTSGVDNAAVVVVDGIGELTTLSIWQGQGTSLKPVYKQSYPHSLGLFYSAMTQAAGFKPNGEEYIFMGLAAHGGRYDHRERLSEEFLDTRGDRILVRLKHNLHKGARKWMPNITNEEDLAWASQKIYEDCLRKVLDWAWHHTGSSNLVLMGGCALNCVANSFIQKWHPWKKVWIMPNPGDAGSSIGAALAHWAKHIEWPGPYLGYEIPGSYPVKALANALEDHGIAAVANGKAEFGPRALGNRSIFADPRIPDIKDRMNWLKKRELFRPFAAVIPQEMAPGFFQIAPGMGSPYMQFVFGSTCADRYPGIAHVDGTCRIQTVTRTQHAGLYDLLMEWYRRTGCPMLINTSLNVKNQPLVNDQGDAKLFQEKYATPVLTGD